MREIDDRYPEFAEPYEPVSTGKHYKKLNGRMPFFFMAALLVLLLAVLSGAGNKKEPPEEPPKVVDVTPTPTPEPGPPVTPTQTPTSPPGTPTPTVTPTVTPPVTPPVTPTPTPTPEVLPIGPPTPTPTPVPTPPPVTPTPTPVPTPPPATPTPTPVPTPPPATPTPTPTPSPTPTPVPKTPPTLDVELPIGSDGFDCYYRVNVTLNDVKDGSAKMTLLMEDETSPGTFIESDQGGEQYYTGGSADTWYAELRYHFPELASKPIRQAFKARLDYEYADGETGVIESAPYHFYYIGFLYPSYSDYTEGSGYIDDTAKKIYFDLYFLPEYGITMANVSEVTFYSIEVYYYPDYESVGSDTLVATSSAKTIYEGSDGYLHCLYEADLADTPKGIYYISGEAEYTEEPGNPCHAYLHGSIDHQ